MQVQPFWLGNKGCSPRPACLCPPHCRSAASWCRHAGAHSTFFYNCLLYCSPNLLVSALCIISQLQAVVVMLVRILLSFTTASSNVPPTFLSLPSALTISCKLLSLCWAHTHTIFITMPLPPNFAFQVEPLLIWAPHHKSLTAETRCMIWYALNYYCYTCIHNAHNVHHEKHVCPFQAAAHAAMT